MFKRITLNFLNSLYSKFFDNNFQIYIQVPYKPTVQRTLRNFIEFCLFLLTYIIDFFQKIPKPIAVFLCLVL